MPSSRSFGFNRDAVTETPFPQSAVTWPWQLVIILLSVLKRKLEPKESNNCQKWLTAEVKKPNVYRGQAGNINGGRRPEIHAWSSGRAPLQIQLRAVMTNYRSYVVISDYSTEARNLDFSGKIICSLNVSNLLKFFIKLCKSNKISVQHQPLA